MREPRDIHIDTILAVLAAMERSGGEVMGEAFEDHINNVVLTPEECMNVWRQRTKPDGTPRFTSPKPVRRFAATEYDPLDG